QTRPQALYSCLWGGDLTAFIDQGNIYALFQQTETFAVNMADYTALTAVKNLPKGIHSGDRYIKTFPNTPAKAAWGEAYRAKYNGERERHALPGGGRKEDELGGRCQARRDAHRIDH